MFFNLRVFGKTLPSLLQGRKLAFEHELWNGVDYLGAFSFHFIQKTSVLCGGS